MVSGDGGDELSTSVGVSAGPTGDATQGSLRFSANCAVCHGDSGHGSLEPPDSTTFRIEGKIYDFPAPGLNTEPGNLASDPAWNAALLAMAARSDVDNGGISLRLPMPDWLTTPGASGVPLSTQDFADIYAFLQTQSQ